MRQRYMSVVRWRMKPDRAFVTALLLHDYMNCKTVACMTVTMTIRLPANLARELKAKASAEKTNPSAVLRKAAAQYVATKAPGRRLNPVQEHIRKYAGRW